MFSIGHFQLVHIFRLSVIFFICYLSACSAPSAISPQQPKAPKNWSTLSADQSRLMAEQEQNWLSEFNDATLLVLVKKAVQNNFNLKAQRAKVATAKEAVDIGNASLFPELSLSVNGLRNKRLIEDQPIYTTDAQLMAQLTYEVDIWGMLSASRKANRLQYAQQLAQYEQAEITLTANIVQAWFDLIEAKQLLALYQQRVVNLQTNLANIQSSYRLGLNQALDVYLAKNDVNIDLALVKAQQQTVSTKVSALQLLLGEYPSGLMEVNSSIPALSTQLNLGVPSTLLTARADIRAQWYALLAKDAELAVAHKQRFPRFSLTAEGGDSSKNLQNLLNGGALVWSLIGNITSPLFNAGKLKSYQEQARLAVVEQEQLYLQQVFDAFAEVENAISEQDALHHRYRYFIKAKENAMSAEKLSFDQYMNGLVNYATVLESQRRSFDAQTRVIQLKNQLIQNRIRLAVALGGQLEKSSFQQASQQQEQAIRLKDLP